MLHVEEINKKVIKELKTIKNAIGNIIDLCSTPIEDDVSYELPEVHKVKQVKSIKDYSKPDDSINAHKGIFLVLVDKETGRILKHYKSMRECSRDTGYPFSTIHRALVQLQLPMFDIDDNVYIKID